MDRRGQIICFVILLGLWSSDCNFGALAQEQDVMTLKPFNIRKDRVTLSGFSSGSGMATVFHMAHSSKFSGVALFSMAYYRCGNGNLIEFGLGCSTWIQQSLLPFLPGDAFGRYNISRAVQDAEIYSSRKLIDPVEGLANQKVFVWTGEYDTLIPVDVAKQNYEFYRNFIPDEKNLMLTTHPTGHDFPTDYTGNNCSYAPLQDSEPQARITSLREFLVVGPRLANCNFSGAYEMMRFMIGDEIVRPNDDTEIGALQLFNQTEFYSGSSMNHISMGDVGWIYIPEYCKDPTNKCLLHFHFHGCGGWKPDSAKNTFTRSRFLHVAEANNVIMVFPLTKSTYVSLNGCWDFFAHTGPDYATQEGGQVKMLNRMLERLLETTSDPEPGEETTSNPDPEPGGAATHLGRHVGILSILLTMSRLIC